MEATQKIVYPMVPVIDSRWIINRAFSLLEMAKGYKQRVKWYFENCLGSPWKEKNIDADYFAQKMREARKRQREAQIKERFIVPNQEQLRPLMEEIKEDDFAILEDIFKNQNIKYGISQDMLWNFITRPDFELKKHEDAILNNVGYEEVNFRYLPKVVEQERLNRIYNFIAAIFLLHYRKIEVRQSSDDMEIWIRKSYINVAE